MSSKFKYIDFQSHPRQIVKNIRDVCISWNEFLKVPSTANLVGGMLRGIDAPEVASS